MNPCDHPHGGGEGRGSPPSAQKVREDDLPKVLQVNVLNF
jgi:ribosomal protein L2